jgi:lactate dehydrogenase-like 2-hydroxyacid dehydrogenase
MSRFECRTRKGFHFETSSQEYLKFNLIKSKKNEKIAINGMGRIGRAALKVILDTPNLN